MKKILFGLIGLTLATTAMATPVTSNITGRFDVVRTSEDIGIKLNIPTTIEFTSKVGSIIIPETMTSLQDVNNVLDRAFDPYEIQVQYQNGNLRPVDTFQMAVTGQQTTDPATSNRYFSLGDTHDAATRCNVVFNRTDLEAPSQTAGGLTLGLIHTATENKLTIKLAGDPKYFQRGDKTVRPGTYEVAGKVWAKIKSE